MLDWAQRVWAIGTLERESTRLGLGLGLGTATMAM